MHLKIQVKQKHIKAGRINDGGNCPIALACRDAAIVCPNVSTMWISYRGSDYYRRSTPLPQKAIEFVDNFDNGKPVKPFSFVVVLK